MLVYIFALAAVLIAFIYWKLKKSHSYWHERGVKQGKPRLFSGDSIRENGSQSLVDMVHYMYNLHPDERYSGVYQFMTPILMIRDTELIKQITVKDFDHFTDHLNFLDDDADTLWTKNLFNLTGEKWHDMRALLSPAFTSSKMKSMFGFMCENAEQFTNYFEEAHRDADGGSVDVELKDAFTRYTNDVIASCAFGVKCDSLRDRDNEFYLTGKELTNMTGYRKQLMFILMLTMPWIFKIALRYKLFPNKPEKFLLNLFTEAVKYREENNVVRPDMIHLLMEARKGRLQHAADDTIPDTGFATVQEADTGRQAKAAKQDISLDVMAAQGLIFFLAGFDSVATTLSFCCYELAINPDIQSRLREEVHQTFKSCEGKITYEALNKMKYLDMVVSESLRKWSPGTAADRVCTRDYTIEPKRPGEVPVHLKKGDVVWIPYFGIHRDARYFPNPDRFDPERFSDENKADVKPYTYFPFGAGPRNCIASRFALLESKTLLFHLINKFELEVVAKTPIPMHQC